MSAPAPEPEMFPGQLTVERYLMDYWRLHPEVFRNFYEARTDSELLLVQHTTYDAINAATEGDLAKICPDGPHSDRFMFANGGAVALWLKEVR